MVSAADTVGSTSSAFSIRMQTIPMASSTSCVAWPIGICQGFPSPKSPRMLISSSIGNLPLFTSERKFTQLPTPLDCISSTPLAPPRLAPAMTPTPSSSVVSGMDLTAGSASDRSISTLCPASGT